MIYPNRQASAWWDEAGNELIVAINARDANVLKFAGHKACKLRDSAIQDVEMLIDNFVRSPCPPAPYAEIAMHVPRRNAVVLGDVEFSGEQWRAVCIRYAPARMRYLDCLVADRKSRNARRLEGMNHEAP